MSNLQLFLAVAPPTLLVLTSLAISVRHASGIRRDIREFRLEVREFSNEMRASLADLHDELNSN